MKETRKEGVKGVMKELPIDKVFCNSWNPNVMDEKEFNLLVKNVQEIGMAVPITVVEKKDGTYMIIGGEHRWKAARLTGEKMIPAVVYKEEDISEDFVKFQTMRLNMIHGKIDPKKFIDMYNSLSNRYTEEVLKESMGFLNQAEWDRLLSKIKAGLPNKDLKERFEQVKEQIKTMEDLSTVLNRLFTEYGCFPPGTLVSTEHGMVPIENVKVGERVFTHLGRLRKVEQVFKRYYSGKLVSIRLQKLGDRIMATPGHEFFIIKGIRRTIFSPKGRFAPNRGKVVKCCAGDLWLDDELIIPSNVCDVRPPDDLPCKLTERFARFIGLYIAEGFSLRAYHKPGRPIKGCRFAFGIHEKKFAEWVRDFAVKDLGIEPHRIGVYVCEKKSTRSVDIRETKIGQWLEEQCGKGAQNKHIPFWVTSQDIKFVVSLLLGLIDGDGSVGARINYGTVSKTLAFQVRDLVALVGKAACYVETVTNKNGKRRQIRVISWSRAAGKYTQSCFVNFDGIRGFTVKLNDYKEINYEGDVYNLSVEEDYSYQVYGAAVGNSTLPYAFMIFDFGGKENLWVRMDKPLFSTMKMIANECVLNKVTLDAVLNEVLIMAFNRTEEVTEVLKRLPKAKIPAGIQWPTEAEVQKAKPDAN